VAIPYDISEQLMDGLENVSLLCVTYQKSANLIYIKAKA
jgi:hypothetical protein